MADLSILDLSLVKIQASKIDPADVPALLAAEQAGKTRKGVVTYLARLLPPDEPEGGPDDDSVSDRLNEASTALIQPAPRNDGQVEIECIIHNVHLGDGRQLNLGERDFVNPDLAALLVGNFQAAYV